MADAGDNYYRGLSSFGNDIAAGLYQYHKEHQAYDAQLGVADALSRLGVDAEGRVVPIGPDTDKSIKPMLDPTAVDRYRNANRRDWAKSAGALEALGRLGMQFINRQGEDKLEPRYDVTIGDQTYPLKASQAAQIGVRREENEAAATAAIPREKRAQARELREQRAANREDARFGLAQQSAQRAAIEKRPEIQFSRKYGLTPQALIGLQESRYVAKDAAGQTLGDTDPLPAGATAKTFPTAPPWWKELITLGLAKPDPSNPQSVQWVPQNDEGQTFRESEFKYGGSAKDNKPSRSRFVPDPEGQFLNVHGTRIPIGEVSTIQNAATAAQSDLSKTLSSDRFQAFTPEQKAAKLQLIKERLSNLGYNPNDPFWGLPQE